MQIACGKSLFFARNIAVVTYTDAVGVAESVGFVILTTAVVLVKSVL